MRRYVDSDRIARGRNAELVGLRDDKYIRCSRCRFMCHVDRDARSTAGSRASEGITRATDSYVLNATYWGSEFWGEEMWGGNGVTQYYGDPTVGQGCPMCGTLLYNKER